MANTANRNYPIIAEFEDPFIDTANAQINAIDADVQGVDEKIDNLTAASIAYDNTTSGLTATEVQAAIDEVADFAIPAHAPTHQAGGSDVINVAGLIGELATLQNAGKLQGLAISVTTPTGGQVLTYNATTMEWEPAAGGGGTLQSAYDGGNEVALDRITKGDFRIVGAGGVAIDVAFDVEIATTGKVKFRTGSAGAPSNWFELDYTTGNVLLGGNHEMVLTANGGEGLNIAARKLVMNVQTNAELYAGEGLNIAARELVMNVQTNAGLYANGTWLQSSQGNMVLNSNFGDVTFSDKNTPLAIKFSDSSNTAFTTTNKSVVGAVNEVKAAIGGAPGIDSVVIAADDTAPRTILYTTPRKTIYTGAGSLYVDVLPNATTVFLGYERVHTNASLECVIIRNSDSTVMVWLMPHETVTFRCVSIASAAGKWVYEISSALKFRMRGYYEDMIARSCFSTPHNVGTGATNTWNAHGRHTLVTGSTSTGSAKVSVGGATVSLLTGVAGCSILMDNASFFLALSTAAEEFFAYMGWTGRIDQSSAEGIYFKYDRLNLGVNWRAVSLAGGVETLVDTGVAVTTAEQRLTIVVNSAFTRADFFINRIHVATITRTAYVGNFISCFSINKLAGTTSVQYACTHSEVKYYDVDR